MSGQILLLCFLGCATGLLCWEAWNITGLPPGAIAELHEEFRELRGQSDLPMVLMDHALSSRLFRMALLLSVNGTFAVSAYFLSNQSPLWWWLVAACGLLVLEWVSLSFVATVRQKKYPINIRLSRTVLRHHRINSADGG